MERTGYDIAMSINPNTSNDVCTFCKHAAKLDLSTGVECRRGFTGYFRSISNLGAIFVSDCGAGEIRDDLVEIR